MNGNGIRFCALTPAAGSGERMRSAVRKPFLHLESTPMFFHTLARLNMIDGCGGVILAVHPDDLEDFGARRLAFLQERFHVIRVVAGGDTRQETVQKMLDLVPPDMELVLIHDGARPLLRPETAQRVIEAAVGSGVGAIAAMPANETVKEVDELGVIKATHPRDSLWMAQTPQVFFTRIVKAAYEKAALNGWSTTDDAALVERAGYDVGVVTGSSDNIKITEPCDLTVASVLLRKQIEDKVFNIADFNRLMLGAD